MSARPSQHDTQPLNGCVHPVCSALAFIAEVAPGQFRVLTDAGWCDADRKQTKKLITAWRKKHNL